MRPEVKLVVVPKVRLPKIPNAVYISTKNGHLSLASFPEQFPDGSKAVLMYSEDKKFIVVEPNEKSGDAYTITSRHISCRYLLTHILQLEEPKHYKAEWDSNKNQLIINMQQVVTA